MGPDHNAEANEEVNRIEIEIDAGLLQSPMEDQSELEPDLIRMEPEMQTDTVAASYSYSYSSSYSSFSTASSSLSSLRRVHLHHPSKWNIFNMILGLLFLLACSMHVTTAQQQYIDLFAPSLVRNYMYTSKIGTMDTTNISWADSGLFSGSQNIATIILPFAFPYFGQSYRTVYLEQNGAIHLDSTGPCCACESDNTVCCALFWTNYPSCSVANAFTNSILVFMTALNISSAGSIRYGYRPSAMIPVTNGSTWNPNEPLIFMFADMSLFINSAANPFQLFDPTRNVPYTFAVSLYSSGKIEFSYWQIDDPTNFYGWFSWRDRPWLVGLKQPSGFSNAAGFANQWSDLNLNGAASNPGNGTYLPRTSVLSNRTFTFTPFGSDACVSPTNGPTSGGVLLSIVLHDYVNGSAGNFRFQCNFIVEQVLVASVNATFSSLLNAVQCVSPPGTLGSVARIVLTVDGVQLPIASFLPHAYVVLLPTSEFNASLYTLDTFCSDCGQFRVPSCVRDCANDIQGTAVIDQCGNCVGGTTNLTYNYNMDCMGICGGPFRNSSAGNCICNSTSCYALTTNSHDFITTTDNQYVYNSFLVDTTLPILPSYLGIDDEEISFYSASFIDITNRFGNNNYYSIIPRFPIPFYGISYNTTYVSKDGALFFELPSADCRAFGSRQVFSSTTSCSYKMIAGTLTEFNPNVTYINPTISYVSTQRSFVIRYLNMPLLYDPPRNSSSTPQFDGFDLFYNFTITLYNSGRVTLRYFTVFDPTQLTGLPRQRTWLVGLVRPVITANATLKASPSPYASPNYLPVGVSPQGLFDLRSQYQWLQNRSLPIGVFPRSSLIEKARVLSFLPASVNFCAWPRNGTAAGGTIVRISFNPSNLPYFSSMILWCSFGSTRVIASFSPMTYTLNCVVPPGTMNTTIPLSILFSVDPNFPSNQVAITSNRLFYSYVPDNLAVNSSAIEVLGFCSDCSAYNNRFCLTDCNGDWRGSAVLDDCGVCTGGLTGLSSNYRKDCYGVCFGGYLMNNITHQCACNASNPNCTIDHQLVPIPTQQIQYIYQENITAVNPSPFALASTISITNALNITYIYTAANFANQLLLNVSLPFTFRLFNSPYRSIYITPYTAIYFDRMNNSCIQNGSLSLFQYSDACFHTLVAGALTNYNISHPQFLVRVTVSDDSVSVAWSNLFVSNSLYSSSSFSNPLSEQFNFSASITLFSSGALRVYYGSFILPTWIDYNGTVYNDGSKVSDRRWMAGVRMGWPSDDVLPFPYTVAPLFTTPIPMVSANELYYLPTNSSRRPSGYFPTPSRLQANTEVAYCPFSIASCLSPKFGQIGSIVQLFTEGVRCDSMENCCYLQLNISCSFGGVSSQATYNVTMNAFQCVVPFGLVNTVVQVWLESNGGKIASTNTNFFTYAPEPFVDSIGNSLCNDCGSLLPSMCPRDCVGVYFGNASLDECGVCFGSDIEYHDVRDCNGVCYGPLVLYNATMPNFPFPWPDNAPSPQCGCIPGLGLTPESLCSVYERTGGDVSLRTTVDSLVDYEYFIMALVILGLLYIVVQQLIIYGKMLKRYLNMSPEERAREARRRERRRRRVRERRERHRRRMDLNRHAPNGSLPPGMAAVPIPYTVGQAPGNDADPAPSPSNGVASAAATSANNASAAVQPAPPNDSANANTPALSPSSPNSQWACPACTLLNSPSVRRCTLCDTRRPSS